MEWVDASPDALESVEDRMDAAIALARRNVEEGTGGPFGAVIVEEATGTIVAPGVNLVVTEHCSVAHAEMVAIMVAQKSIESFDLGSQGLPAYQLVSSTEPCAMCMGAVPWSGVRSLVCGARDEDARTIGFDEGDKPSDWPAYLEQRGIRVTRDICREAAADVLRDYVNGGGALYNSRSGV